MFDRTTRRSVLATAAAWIAGWPALAMSDEAKIFHGVGTVTGVDMASGVLTVDHGDIPGLMDAVEMAYKAPPASLAQGLQKGDKIAFGVDGKTYTIVEINKAGNP